MVIRDRLRTVHEGHDRLLAAKRDELVEIVRQCMEAIHRAAGSNPDCKTVITTADTFYDQRKQRIKELQSLALLDGLVPSMLEQKDEACSKLEILNKPAPTPAPTPKPTPAGKPAPKKIIRAYNRQIVFPAKQLESEEDIDDYVEKMRAQLKALMKNCDGIKLN